MSDLLEKTQKLYDEYVGGSENAKDELIVAVCEYIKPTIKSVFLQYHESVLTDEVISDVVIYLLEGGIEKYQPGAASFAVYCASIAKKKAIDRYRRLLVEEKHFCEAPTKLEDEELDFLSMLEDKTHRGNPEIEYMNDYIRREIYDASRTLIDLFLNDTGKPYMTVGAGYSIVLFNYLTKGTKILASPQWAFEQLVDSSVSEGGDIFVNTIRKVLREPSIRWCDDFYDQLEDEDRDFEVYLGELVFGEKFQKKDFENWTFRYKAKMLKQMLERDIKAEEIFL